MKKKYIFKSERLGFRNWLSKDLNEFSKINSDVEVMQHFPNTLTQKETKEFIERLQKHYLTHGYNYFAVEILATGQLIGFIGLSYQDYRAEFNPSVDIGWRLKQSAWGKGYASEGAKRCLKYAFEALKISKVISVCTVTNIASEKVMQKIGMTKKGVFKHPKLKDFPEYENCYWYEIKKV